MRELVDVIVAELNGSWRYRWLAMTVAWIVCLSGWFFVYQLPDSYESKATVFVDTTSVLTPLLKSLTVNPDVLSRVEAVTTAMLGRPQIEKVANQTNLTARAATIEDANALIDGLQARISITSDRRRGANIYQISYTDEDPQLAHEVVGTLLTNFIEDSVGETLRESQSAQKFLRSELLDLEAELTSSEQRLADFKRENVGRMPGAEGDYFARLQIQMSKLEETEANLRLANRRKQTLQQQLSGEMPQMESASGPKSALDIRIAENQSRLEELRLRFTDLHPDVVAVSDTLEQLRNQKRQQLDQMSQTGGVGIPSENPVYQSIQIELATINVEISALEEQRATDRRRIKTSRELVDVLPEVEARMAKLNRDYDVKQAQYRSLLQRLEVAELSESAEQSEEVKIRIIDPPIVPRSPIAPNRPLLLAVFLFLGLGSGAGLAYLINQAKPVFGDVRTLREESGLPVLGTIMTLTFSSRRYRKAVQISAFSGALLALCAVFLFTVLFHESASHLVREINWIETL